MKEVRFVHIAHNRKTRQPIFKQGDGPFKIGNKNKLNCEFLTMACCTVQKYKQTQKGVRQFAKEKSIGV